MALSSIPSHSSYIEITISMHIHVSIYLPHPRSRVYPSFEKWKALTWSEVNPLIKLVSTTPSSPSLGLPQVLLLITKAHVFVKSQSDHGRWATSASQSLRSEAHEGLCFAAEKAGVWGIWCLWVHTETMDSRELFQQLRGSSLSRRSGTQYSPWKTQLGEAQSWRLGYPSPDLMSKKKKKKVSLWT